MTYGMTALVHRRFTPWTAANEFFDESLVVAIFFPFFKASFCLSFNSMSPKNKPFGVCCGLLRWSRNYVLRIWFSYKSSNIPVHLVKYLFKALLNFILLKIWSMFWTDSVLSTLEQPNEIQTSRLGCEGQRCFES